MTSSELKRWIEEYPEMTVAQLAKQIKDKK